MKIGNLISAGVFLASIITTIVFIVLQLCKVIEWSWWWVLAPLWIYFGVYLIILAICVVMILVLKVIYSD